MGRLRVVAVSATSGVGFLTILAAFVLARANGVYCGGLLWPYLSDLGRDPPGSFVLFFGLNIVAVLLGLTWTFNHEYKLPFVRRSVESGQIGPCVRSLTYASGAFGILGAFGLPVFASFAAPPAMHDCAAAAFVVCEALAMLLNTFLNYRIFLAKRDEMESGVFITDRFGPRSVSRIRASQLEAVKRSFVIELASVALFAMSVGVYLPVLYDDAPAPHLTVAECVAKGLGETYCSDTMRLDDTDTKLWNYENDLAVHQMRALAQLGCVLALLIYALSFVVDNREEGEEPEGEKDRVPAALGQPGTPPLYYYHSQQRVRVPPRRASSEGGTPRRLRAQSSPSTRRERRSPHGPSPRAKLLSGRSDGAIAL